MASRHSTMLFVLLPLLLSTLVASSSGHEFDCGPCVNEWLTRNPDLLLKYTYEQLCDMCHQNWHWADQARRAGNVSIDSEFTPNQWGYIRQLQECQGYDCMKLLPSNKRHPVHRKEYRAMSDFERRQFHEAVQKTKMDEIDGMSKYDLLVKCHSPRFAPGAHWGPAFLPFHREYLKQFELSLRLKNPDVALPYWDSTLDEGLPSPADSIMWTADFLGNGNGFVVEGPFANWVALEEPNGETTGYKNLRRRVGIYQGTLLYQKHDIDLFVSFNRYSQFDPCYDQRFETEHGFVHHYVGGHMRDTPKAPSDPAFFLHHSFIDYVWESFRQNRQTPDQRVIEYSHITSEMCPSRAHYPYERMRPFSIRNIDGLSLNYVDVLYGHEASPGCSATGEGCTPASPYLFCNRRRHRCLAKVRPGGDCRGLETEDACYGGHCVDGVCI